MVRCTANAFSLLSLHEETDASSVAKLMSKRAQKRLQREAEHRELAMVLEQSLREVPCSTAPHHTPTDSPFQGFKDEDFSEMSDELFEQWLAAQAALPSPQQLQDMPPQAHWLGKAKAAEHLPEPSPAARNQTPTPRPTRTKHPPQSPPTHEEAFPPLPAPAPPSPVVHDTAKLRSSPLKPSKRSDVRVLNTAKPYGGADWEMHHLARVSSLDLEWDLRLDGMVPKTVNVPDHMSNLDANAVCKQQVWSQLERQGSWDDERASDRNCDFGTVWQMMGKAATKHRLHSGGDASSSSSSSGGDGWSRSGEDGTPYWSKIAGKDWRPQVEAMVRRGWEPVTSRGKHLKFRRELLDGSVQTIMVPCTPSDSIRGICNFQADLARQDREAHCVLQQVLRED